MNENSSMTRRAEAPVARATLAGVVAREKNLVAHPTRRAKELVARATHAGDGAAGTNSTG